MDVIIFYFWHLYQIHSFSNILNDEEMMTSHLMRVIRYPNNCRGKLPPVRVGVWFRIRVNLKVGRQILSGTIVLEPCYNYFMIKMSQLFVTTFMLQLFYDKIIMFQRKKNNNRETLQHATWQNHSVIARFRVLKGLKWQKNKKLPPFRKFVTEVLIFRSTRSQVFFKIGISILEPLSNIVAGLLLQNT